MSQTCGENYKLTQIFDIPAHVFMKLRFFRLHLYACTVRQGQSETHKPVWCTININSNTYVYLLGFFIHLEDRFENLYGGNKEVYIFGTHSYLWIPVITYRAQPAVVHMNFTLFPRFLINVLSGCW